MKIQLFMLLTMAQISLGLVGYDCGGTSMNVTTISTTRVAECNIPLKNPEETTMWMQLLQVSEFGSVEVMECKIEIHRTVTYCGYWYNNFNVLNGKQEYLYRMEHRECKKLQETGSIRLGYNAEIEGVQRNSTQHRTVTLAGSYSSDGYCYGTSYSDPFGSWVNVVVDATVKITIKNYYATVDYRNDKVVLNSGSRCEWSEEGCMDQEGNNAFWEVLREDICHSNKHVILFEGQGMKIKGDQDEPEIYTINTEEVTFALSKKLEKDVCGYKLIQTEHPKLLIKIDNKVSGFPAETKIKTQDLDMFTYINSKFVYVEKHIKRQMKALYRDILVHKCELERQIIANALMLTDLKPEQFAYTIMKGPGYYATMAGELIYLVKCVPVEVSLRRTQECYQELPVTHKNQSWFLTPKTRMLTKQGIMIDCNPMLAAGYEIDGAWVIMKPEIEKISAPQILTPMTTPTWTYEDPQYLATSGIYTGKDLDSLRSRIMLPAEVPAIVNTIIRGATGLAIAGNNGIYLNPFLDELSLKEMAKGEAMKIWEDFIVFGSASAGVMAIIMIIKLIKAVADTVLHGYALHQAYGCSLYLLGAVWDSVTHLLLHLARGPLDAQRQGFKAPDSRA